jgi:hypothetical protein
MSAEALEVRDVIISAAKASVCVMALTIAHHAYGAYIYPAAFRGHVALFAVPVTAAIIITTMLGVPRKGRRGSRVARMSAATLMAAIPVLFVGLYEGLYNHLFKNLIYLLGLYEQVAAALFPTSLYEPPSDWLFEVSGVIQFFVATIAARKVWKLVRLLAHEARA